MHSKGRDGAGENNGMDLHDIFVRELLETKSLEALRYLIQAGRELEFTVHGACCFLSRSGSAKDVSLWVGNIEQDFDSMEELLEYAQIDGHAFRSIWGQAEIGFLF